MHNRLRRAVAYLLLLLMPLQAMAVGVVVACPMESMQSAVTDVVMENCDDPTMIHAGTPDAYQHEHSLADAPDASHDVPHSSPPCGMSTGCFALASIGLLPGTRTFSIEPGFTPIGFADNFYRSYIPEGLQRPPQTTHS